MNDDPVRLSMIGQVLRRRWRLLLVFAMFGAVVGAGASFFLSPGYETSTNVLLQGARQADELKTETQVATSSVVLDRAADALGWGGGAAALESSVSAEVVDGNVIAVTATADTPENAQQLADRVAHEYVAFSTQLANDTADASTHLLQEQQDALRDQIEQTNDLITLLHGAANGPGVESVQVRTQLEAVRTALNEAMTTLAESESSTSRTNLVVMGPAERPNGQAAPTPLQLMVGGALLAVLVGMFGHLFAARGDRRLYTDADITAALGTTTLGSVTVAADGGADLRAKQGPRWLAVSRRLLQLDKPWLVERLPAAESERDQAVRYRRVVQRLRGGSNAPANVLVLVADDDPEAYAGVARLAATAADREPIDVVTDTAAFAEAVERLDLPGPRPGVRSTADPVPAGDRTVLRLAELSPNGPAIPPALAGTGTSTSGVVLVTTAGTRTGWELARLGQTCLDAGERVLGTVIVHRSRPVATERSATPPPAPTAINDNAMAGSP